MARVLLKVPITSATGAMNYAGERVSIPDALAERLLAAGECIILDAKPEGAPVNKPVAVPGGLRGFAKQKFLRDAIMAKGGTPQGRTIAELMDELRRL